MFNTEVDMSCVLTIWPVLLGTLLGECFIKGVGHDEHCPENGDRHSQSSQSCKNPRVEI